MQSTAAQPYAKRNVPTPDKDLGAWPSRLASWLAIEFGNVQRGMIRPTSRTVSADTTATANDGLVLADTTAAAVTVTLPDPLLVHDMVVTVKRISAGAHAVTIGATVDGVLNPTLGSQWAAKTMWAHTPTGGVAKWYCVATV